MNRKKLASWLMAVGAVVAGCGKGEAPLASTDVRSTQARVAAATFNPDNRITDAFAEDADRRPAAAWVQWGRAEDQARVPLLGEADIRDVLVGPLTPDGSSPTSGAKGGTAGDLGSPTVGFPAKAMESPELRNRVIDSVSAALISQSERLVEAATRGAILDELRIEAELTVIHEDVRRTAPAGAAVPNDPLVLLDVPALEASLKRAKDMRRFIDAKSSLVSAGLLKPYGDYLDQRIDRLIRSLGSKEANDFRQNPRKPWEKIGDGKWAIASATRSARTETEFQGRVRELVSLSPHLQGFTELMGARGPPSLLEQRVATAFRDYFIDPTGSLSAEVQLAGLDDLVQGVEPARREGLAIGDAPSRAPLSFALRFVRRDFLQNLRHDLRVLLAAHSKEYSGLFVDGAYVQHLTNRIELIDAELQVRPKQTLSFDEFEALTKGAAGAVLAEDVSASLSRGKSWFLTELGSRYPREYWPDSCVTLATRLLRDDFSAANDRLIAVADRLHRTSDLAARGEARFDAATAGQVYRDRLQLKAIATELRDARRASEATLDSGLDDDAKKAKVDFVAAFVPPPPPDTPPPPTDTPPPPDNRPPPGPGDSPGGTNPRWTVERLPQPPPGRRVETLPGSVVASSSAPLSLAAIDARSQVLSQQVGDGSAPPLQHRSLGRIVVPAASIAQPDFKMRAVTLKHESRQPAHLQEWDSLRDKEGKLYDLDVVLALKEFDAVGGGIHFGSKLTVRNDAGIDLRSYGLVYDPTSKQLQLRNAEGDHILPLAKIEPEVLKALYGFARSERNVAVTIGWGGSGVLQRSDDGQPVLLDRYFVDSAVGPDIAVADLLPWSLREKVLPNGQANPVATEFGEAYDLDISSDAVHRAIAAFVGELSSGFGTASASSIIADRSKAAEDAIRVAAEAFKTSKSSYEEAASEYRQQQANRDPEPGALDIETLQKFLREHPEALRNPQRYGREQRRSSPSDPFAPTEDNAPQVFDPSQFFPKRAGGDTMKRQPTKRLGQLLPKKQPGFFVQPTERTLEQVRERAGAANRAAKEVGRVFTDLWWPTWVAAKGMSSATSQEFIATVSSIPSSLDQSGLDPSGFDRFLCDYKEMFEKMAKEMGPKATGSDLAFVFLNSGVQRYGAAGLRAELWCALATAQLTRSPQARPAEHLAELTALLEEVMNPTTLAVLLPEPVELRIGSKNGELVGGMRYAYVTGRVEVDQPKGAKASEWTVRRHVMTGPDDRETRDLVNLTRVANTNMPSLEKSYAPLARVSQYSRIVSLLRWAGKSVDSKELLFIDMSSLAAVEERSRGRFPTPDALSR